MTIIPEPEWEMLFTELLRRSGTAMIIGATDSGKSTLAKYLIEEAISRNFSVCLLDADVGQSSIGLPGTICSKTFFSAEDLQDYFYRKISYAGTINPATNICEIIDIVTRMSSECRIRSDVSLIDTSGLIDSEIGERLKTGKVRAVNPDHVIAIQRGNEIEHILDLLPAQKIHRIRVSKNIQARTFAMRTRYRKMKYDAYFQRDAMNDFIIHASESQFVYKGRQVPVQNRYVKKDTLIGLNQNNDTLALGILEDLSDGSITFSSPIGSLNKINRVVFGDVTYERAKS
jgi:polynucleotide 5'-hydroxyl-kinase GRC3/NOL9